MENIIRPTEPADRKFIDVDLGKPKRKRKTTRQKFQGELSTQEIEANKKGLPFARNQARADFEADLQTQMNAQIKKYGSVEYPEELKVPKMDWSKYSDLKNFTIISEKEREDDNLSNKNPGLNVRSKTVRYQYKDYAVDRYIVMEAGPSSIKRAVINRARLDKQVSAQIEDEDKPKKK